MTIDKEKEIELLKEKNLELRLNSLETNQRLREELLDTRLKAVEDGQTRLTARMEEGQVRLNARMDSAQKWLIGILVTAVGELLLITLALIVPGFHLVGR